MNEKEVQDYINRLITLQKNGVPEIDHAETDNILCEIIAQLRLLIYHLLTIKVLDIKNIFVSLQSNKNRDY